MTPNSPRQMFLRLIPTGDDRAQLEIGYCRTHTTMLIGNSFIEREAVLLFDCPDGFEATERIIDDGEIGNLQLTPQVWAQWTPVRTYGDYMWYVVEGGVFEKFYHGVIAMLNMPCR